MEDQTTSPLPDKKQPPLMSFPDAMQAVIEGKKVTRVAWEDDMFFGILKDGFLMLHKDDDKYYQWIVSDGDLLSEDWILVQQVN